MTPDERLEALERRLENLEGTVRALLPGRFVPAAPIKPAAGSPRPEVPAPPAAAASPPVRRPRLDWEQWLGQRGLLALGVFALILAVAVLAGLKVIFFDLSSLGALYRVGSVLILALVSLGMAYLYHRQGRAE